MKRAVTLVFVFAIFFLLSFHCFAHSGDTDARGGHYDHSTGEYHYHHGYSAHQHPNGRCPYESAPSSNSKPSQSSSSSSSSSDDSVTSEQLSVAFVACLAMVGGLLAFGLILSKK